METSDLSNIKTYAIGADLQLMAAIPKQETIKSPKKKWTPLFSSKEFLNDIKNPVVDDYKLSNVQLM